MKESNSFKAAKAANRTVNLIIILILIVSLLVSGYAFYDSWYLTNQVDRFTPSDDEGIYASFMKLREENSDVVAWIRVDDSNINYPVLKGTDNETYLSLDAEKKSSSTGSIFMDYRNAADFTDMQTVLYGHNMSGGRMFADVKNFSDQSYFESHKTGRIYLPDKILEFDIVEYLQADSMDRIIYGVPHNTVESVSELASHLNDISIYQRETITTDANYITLSTCTVVEEYGRHLLVCKITGESPVTQN
ncbi:MAG: class B sortase [Eubacteriaceae bacterium]|jgi:sortase B